MDITKFPKSGSGFSLSGKPSSFINRLRRFAPASLSPENRAALVGALEVNLDQIKRRGGLNPLRKQNFFRKIKELDNTFTRGDKQIAEQIYKHLSRGAKDDDSFKGLKPLKDIHGNVLKDSEGNVYYDEEKWNSLQARVRRGRALDKVDVKKLHERQYAGGKVQSTTIGAKVNNPLAGGIKAKGTISDYNLEKNPAGFVKNYKAPPAGFVQDNEGKSAGNLPSGIPPGGQRPIGL